MSQGPINSTNMNKYMVQWTKFVKNFRLNKNFYMETKKINLYRIDVGLQVLMMNSASEPYHMLNLSYFICLCKKFCQSWNFAWTWIIFFHPFIFFIMYLSWNCFFGLLIMWVWEDVREWEHIISSRSPGGNRYSIAICRRERKIERC
jgi:hypothetical protein